VCSHQKSTGERERERERERGLFLSLGFARETELSEKGSEKVILKLNPLFIVFSMGLETKNFQ